MANIFICAGDPSGDVHAARLMEKLLEKRSDINFIGIGGKNMSRFGLKSLAKIEDISVVGFWEVANRISYFRKLMQQCKDIIHDSDIDLFIPVDYPGFNISLASFAKKNKIPVVYYIAPQLWAWGKNRAEKLVGATDKVLVVFPFEEEYFKNFGVNATFIGHPLMDNPQFQQEPINFEHRNNVVAILPGSRSQEIEKHINLFSSAAMRFRDKHNDFSITLAKSPNVDISKYNDFFEQNDISITDDSIELMKHSKIGIVKTGTSNLEAALIGMPFSMVYKTSFFSYIISKRLINLDYISIVNILKNDSIIDELIQSDANPIKIADSLSSIITNSKKLHRITDSFGEIRNSLSAAGASDRSADIMLEYL